MIQLIIYILIFFIPYFYYANSSYGGLLIPTSSSILLTSNEEYELDKYIVLDTSYKNNYRTQKISSSLVILSQDINVGSFQYDYKIRNYNFQSSMHIINYGQFIDSESNYTFSSQDFIFKNKISKKLSNFLYTSGAIKYINSSIDTYTSNALAVKLNLHYYLNKIVPNGILFHIFLNNYGFTINRFTNYKEQFPTSYGSNIMFSPKYINALISFQYESFSDYNQLNMQSEFFISNFSSIFLGYTSLANHLYSGEFNDNIFTGASLGITTKYKNYFLDIAIKNLGILGTMTSFTIIKSFN